ncbi:MAG: hypothetical protein GX272_06615 [Epulopiscium sp.]|nr:hypothetical protein [Candidatus Epulonipiscium sp.]
MYITEEYTDTIKKQRKAYFLALTLVIILSGFILKFISDYSITSAMKESDYSLEVRGLSLKYLLISIASELYDVNVRIKEDQGPFYKLQGDETYDHYKWIKKTYSDMDHEMKSYLNTIYLDGANEGKLIYIVAELGDEAGINQINYKIQSSTLPNEIKNAAEKFYPFFYENYLKDYIEMKRYKYNDYFFELNQHIQKEKFDLLGFIERLSGIEYDKHYKPVLYYTMRPGNAWGFTYKDLYIALIPIKEDEYEDFFYILYHEYSHGIFKTITDKREFKKLAEVLKNNSTMYNAWNNNYYNQFYTWEEWCEENLVEGFAMYLDYRVKGKKPKGIKSIRPYDQEYFEYLVQNHFDPAAMELEYITIKFLKEIAQMSN